MSHDVTRVGGVSHTMTTSDVAAFWGVTRNTAQKRIGRWGIPIAARDPGRGGENRYARADIESHGRTGVRARSRKPS